MECIHLLSKINFDNKSVNTCNSRLDPEVFQIGIVCFILVNVIVSVCRMNFFVESVLRAFLVEKFCVKPKEEVCFSRFEEEQNIGELFGLTSTMIFGRIEYLKNNESQMTESIAVKQSADLNFESEVDYYSMQFANEIHFFSKVIPTISNLTNGEFESFFPKFLYSYSKTMPSYNRDVIIFENLRALDFCVASPDKMQKHSSTKKGKI